MSEGNSSRGKWWKIPAVAALGIIGVAEGEAALNKKKVLFTDMPISAPTPDAPSGTKSFTAEVPEAPTATSVSMPAAGKSKR